MEAKTLEAAPALCAKAAQIIAAARAAFLAQGYEATTMDDVARRAGVAKQTVYAHFSSKDKLFLAVADAERKCFAAALPDLGNGPGDIVAALRQIGRHMLDRVLSPELLTLFRMVLATTHRFPALGHEAYEASGRQIQAELAGFMGRAMDAGALRRADPAVAAAQFASLVRGELQFRCLFDPTFTPASEEIDRHLAAALDCFLAKYGVEAA